MGECIDCGRPEVVPTRGKVGRAAKANPAAQLRALGQRHQAKRKGVSRLKTVTPQAAAAAPAILWRGATAE
jgi:hypothetical protein